jgi:N,N'-diacetyllegionaminate synthase
MGKILNVNEPYLIAETAYSFEGDKNYLIKLISELKKKKASDAIKYHVLLDLNKYALKDHPVYSFIKDFLLSEDDWLSILKMTKRKGFETIVLADEEKAIDFCIKNISLIDAIEIHAVAVNNFEMLNKLKKFNKPILLGVGGTEIEEIKIALDYLKNKKIILMHGFQNYPTKYEFINLNKISSLKKEFSLLVGYADHCAWDFEHNELITLAGFMSGAHIIEKHVVLDKGKKKIDFESAINTDDLANLRKKLKLLQISKGDGCFELNVNEKIYGKNGPMKFTIVANRKIKKDSIICKEDLTFRRTKKENNVQQKEYLNFLGKKAKKDIKKNELINWGNIRK